MSHFYIPEMDMENFLFEKRKGRREGQKTGHIYQQVLFSNMGCSSCSFDNDQRCREPLVFTVDSQVWLAGSENDIQI